MYKGEMFEEMMSEGFRDFCDYADEDVLRKNCSRYEGEEARVILDHISTLVNSAQKSLDRMIGMHDEMSERLDRS